MNEDKKEYKEGPYDNPHLLVTGSFAALGGLVIYAIITVLFIVMYH